VETIGDCYVIVSGLPHRNDQQHALEIARLATTLRDSMLTFKVRHLPDKVLQLRIGLNSGEVFFLFFLGDSSSYSEKKEHRILQ
jgi:atrial natriuretic peptide receptor A